MESLYSEFIDWAKFVLIGIGGMLFTILMWRSEGLFGKAIVIIVAVYIVVGAIIKTHSKYLDEKNKIKHQHEKILLERMGKIDGNIKEIAIRFQRYLDEDKKENTK
jgi:hypothetical protein